mmetsp:Transcript_17438/g.37652  ORF Transcript_17438/g.37652 Transcript_17438/m.37652 type:complete len:213 (+) Transcript_17438:345-983(+)
MITSVLSKAFLQEFNPWRGFSTPKCPPRTMHPKPPRLPPPPRLPVPALPLFDFDPIQSMDLTSKLRFDFVSSRSEFLLRSELPPTQSMDTTSKLRFDSESSRPDFLLRSDLPPIQSMDTTSMLRFDSDPTHSDFRLGSERPPIQSMDPTSMLRFDFYPTHCDFLLGSERPWSDLPAHSTQQQPGSWCTASSRGASCTAPPHSRAPRTPAGCT